MRRSAHSKQRSKRTASAGLPEVSRLALAAVLPALAGCGDGATEPPPDPNQAPQPTSAIPRLEIAVGDSAAVDLAGHFRDPDGDPLTFAVTSSDPGVAAATLTGNVATVRGASRGTANVTVTATDPGGLSAGQTFEASVPNQGPEAVGSVEDRQLEVGDSIAIGVSALFTDPEGDALAFSAASSDESVVRAEMDGDSVEIAAVAKGVATVTITASDPGGETSGLAFAVTVPNRAPFVSDAIPADSLLLGDTIELRLNAYFADPDGDLLGFSAESSHPGVATARVSGRSLVVATVAPGRTTVTVVASDPEGLAAAQSFEVTAAHPNRAPVAVGGIADRTIYVGSVDSVDVSSHFSDPDGDPLSFAVATSRRIRVAVAAHGNIIALTAASVGSSTITVTARDPDGLGATHRFRAVVEPVPVPDLVVESPAVDRDSVEVEGDFTLRAVVRNQGDAEARSPGTFRVYESFDTRITTGDREVGRDSVPPLGANDASEVSVRVTGPSLAGFRFYGACVDAPAAETSTGNNCSAAVAVVFWQANHAPQPRGSIRARTLGPGDTFTTGLTPFFMDPDGDLLRYSAQSSDDAVATASTSGDVLTVVGRSAGTATITVTARDITTRPPGSLAATQRFEVTVELRPRPDLVVDMVQDSFAIGLAGSFILGAEVRNQGNLDAAAGAAVRFLLSTDSTIDASDSPVGADTVGAVPQGWRQTASVTVASAGQAGVYYYGACVNAVADETRTDNNCSRAVTVQVVELDLPNRPPTVQRRYPDVTDAYPGQRHRLPLAGVFSDPDGHPLTVTAQSSNETVARAEISAGEVSVRFLGAGTAIVTVTATDPGGLSASTAFEVTVRVRLQPDLVVDMVQDSVATGPAQSFVLSAEVRNQGTQDAASGAAVRFYLSTDTTIDASDSQVGADTVGAVPEAGQQTVSVTLTSADSAGAYHYGACVNVVGNESRTDNNCSRAVTVKVEEPKIQAPTTTPTPNQPPTLLRGFRDVPDAFPGQRFRAPLGGTFSDPDGDPLTVTARSSNETVARAEIANDSVYVNTLDAGTAVITVTATDPGGLSARTSFRVTVQSPCPGFCIARGFTNTVTRAARDVIHAAASGWEDILQNNELSDIRLPVGYSCGGLAPSRRAVDDHMVLSHVGTIDGPGGTLAFAGVCARRSGDGFPIVSIAVYDVADIDHLISVGSLAGLALHEIAHGLGFSHGYLGRLGLTSARPEPHFSGPGARAAFDSAGGTGYTGAKVPMEAELNHWSESVFEVELMTPRLEVGGLQPVSAITIAAMADIGYSVNVSLADSYTLPGARPAPPARDRPRQVFDLSNDVMRGPVTILDPGGQVVDITSPPPGYVPPEFDRQEVTIEPRPSGAVRPPPESRGPRERPDDARAADSSYVSWILTGSRQPVETGPPENRPPAALPRRPPPRSPGAPSQADRQIEHREEPEREDFQPDEVPWPRKEQEW